MGLRFCYRVGVSALSHMQDVELGGLDYNLWGLKERRLERTLHLIPLYNPYIQRKVPILPK